MNREKIRVVHLITKLELGGAQVNTIYTYEHLEGNSFDAYLVSGPGGILTDRIEKKENFYEIPHLIRAINPVKDLKAFMALRKLFKKIRPHIVHTHSSKAGILGRLVCFSLGIPVVIHSVHGFSFSPFQPAFKRNFFKWAEKIVARLTSHFIFVSKDDIEAAKEVGLVKNNYSLIRSGFPFAKFQRPIQDKTSIFKRFSIPESAFVCGIIAPFKPQKGLFHLIEVAELIVNQRPDVIFIITGDGDLRPEIEARLKERGIFDNFRLPGFLFDIEQAIELFDIGISTALWEGLPQSLVQLRLKKKPVLASNIAGNREVVKEDKNGFLVDVQDYKRYAEKILWLIDHPEERQRLANFPEDFSAWDAQVMVAEQEGLYRRLLERKKSE
jgi:glycosyltransferase involved in cell wall biosynthesis